MAGPLGNASSKGSMSGKGVMSSKGNGRRQPSLAQLRAFAAVAEHLHFRDAAAAIGMSQPALSGAVSVLAETVRAPFTGALRLGVIPTVAPYLLPTVLNLVHDRYPDLDLQVHEEQTANLLEGLQVGRLDL